jgi:hypothetical protein
VATYEWIESAAHAGSRRPVGEDFRAATHTLGGAYAQQDDPERHDAEMFVRRRFNRHGCPGAHCDHPRHDEDVTAMAEALEWLGLRPTVRTGRRR